MGAAARLEICEARWDALPCEPALLVSESAKAVAEVQSVEGNSQRRSLRAPRLAPSTMRLCPEAARHIMRYAQRVESALADVQVYLVSIDPRVEQPPRSATAHYAES